MRSRAAVLVALAAVALAETSTAQPGGVHGVSLPFMEIRPLDARVAAADAAAVGTVEQVDI